MLYHEAACYKCLLKNFEGAMAKSTQTLIVDTIHHLFEAAVSGQAWEEDDWGFDHIDPVGSLLYMSAHARLCTTFQ